MNPDWEMLLGSPGNQRDRRTIVIVYDHHRLAAEMRQEKLPEEFIETVRTGWWTTCLEILPAKERSLGRH